MSTKEDAIDVTPEDAGENGDRKGGLQLHDQDESDQHQQTAIVLAGSPVMPSDLEIVGTILDGGIRPIGASHLDIVGTLGAGRPVTSSHLRIAEMMGNRPIFFDEVKLIDDVDLPGHRPIMVSNPGLMHAEMVLRQRPIYSNAIDDAPSLMGYLD